MNTRPSAQRSLLLAALWVAPCACSSSSDASGGGDGASDAMDASPGAPSDAAGAGIDATLETGGDAASDGAAIPDVADADASCPDGGCDGGASQLCVPGAMRCAGNGIETCADGGQWGDAAACGGSTPFCASATCTATQVPASCQQGGDGLTNCGASRESCCTSLEVTGGTFYRTYDQALLPGGPITIDGGPPAPADPATISTFRLDKYEVTVGRFRQFVSAWNNGSGYAPPAGSGKHTHVNGGQGLVMGPGPPPKAGPPDAGASVDAGITFEPGWVASDDSLVVPTDGNLACDSYYATWTSSPGSNETRPINCVTWWEAYAFCIWDGGFLPSWEEWEYAAAGGSEQREYPWGSTDPGTSNLFSIYGCHYPQDAGSCTGAANIAPVGTAVQGVGLWGQLDLTGNVWEWVLDNQGPNPNPCTDCMAPISQSDQRGGSFDDSALIIPANIYRASFSPRSYPFGFRCARTP
jgi:formylglycine-generating enzyme required for sulfatase activity